MKVAEAAEALGVSQTTVRRLIRRGSLRPCRALRHVLIPVSEVRRLLGQQS
ncbi:MAG: helix-turn-helix domain-containing protein [Verrucomicrobiae bacterium]|nr:helix-turn-helix domain-containing protein [Verrucomicrobiae bacterium]